MVVGRVVTATIALTCVLIVYDGWADLRLRDAIYVVGGPVLTIFIAHVFSASLVLEMELGRRPTRREWITRARFESGFLLVAVPPIAILIILDLAAVSLNDSIQVIIWLEALSLSFWAGLAAYRAGLRGRSLAMAVVAGLVVSGIVLGLLVIPEPGKAAPERRRRRYHSAQLIRWPTGAGARLVGAAEQGQEEQEDVEDVEEDRGRQRYRLLVPARRARKAALR